MTIAKVLATLVTVFIGLSSVMRDAREAVRLSDQHEGVFPSSVLITHSLTQTGFNEAEDAVGIAIYGIAPEWEWLTVQIKTMPDPISGDPVYMDAQLVQADGGGNWIAVFENVPAVNGRSIKVRAIIDTDDRDPPPPGSPHVDSWYVLIVWVPQDWTFTEEMYFGNW